MHIGIGPRALCICIVLAAGIVAADAAAQASPHYDVVALRVEFQPDTTRFTTGDGTFEGLRWPDGISPVVDPLPHSDGYFGAHLEFLEHYVASVSGGRTTLTTRLLPTIVRLSREMGTYSPTGPAADSTWERQKLVQLVTEAWTLAAGNEDLPDLAGLDPERIFFLLFHAGIGRDVELLGTVLQKTPLDLPSLYFGPATLESYDVPPLQVGGLPVTNSALVPRTESRLGYSNITEDSLLLELSINGLLASSFVSFLGIPDLFNTATGESAIGGFGLMDPQGIFAYAGLFPPAPSAWTRQELGWVKPQELTGPGPIEVSLQFGEAARASISSAEYFLIENRQRDPDGDGLVLSVWQDGTVIEQRISAITDDFSRFSVDAFASGVVVGVDDYDFALPGRDADDNQYPGGFLIWHVDERLTGTSAVNADPERRGLDLEEADAAQDLGYANTAGSPFDFFYEGNPVHAVLPSGREIRFYENRFGPATVPSSATNGGGAGFVTLENFSAPGSVMSFMYRQEGAAGIAPLDDIPLGSPVGMRSSVGGGNTFSFVFDPDQPGQTMVAIHGDGGAIAATIPSLVRPAAQGNTLVALAKEEGQYVIKRLAAPDFSLVEAHVLPTSASALKPQGPVMLADNRTAYALLSGAAQSLLVTAPPGGTTSVRSLPSGGRSLALSPSGTLLLVTATGIFDMDGKMRWSIAEGGQVVFAEDEDGLWGAMTHPAAMALHILETDGQVHVIDLASYGLTAPPAASVALADVDADGAHEVVVTAGLTLAVFERAGAMATHYPILMEAHLTGQPLVAVDGQDAAAIIVVTDNSGRVHALQDGRALEGFPLSIGHRIAGTPRLTSGRLDAVTGQAVLRSYAVTSLGDALWGERYQSSANKRFAAGIGAPGPATQERLLVAAETYNWPNPVRDGITHLRLMTGTDATVTITVVDIAGTVVHETALEVRGGSPAEVRWMADVASGLYYARIKATTQDGTTDTRLIRVAVIQ